MKLSKESYFYCPSCGRTLAIKKDNGIVCSVCGLPMIYVSLVTTITNVGNINEEDYYYSMDGGTPSSPEEDLKKEMNEILLKCSNKCQFSDSNISMFPCAVCSRNKSRNPIRDYFVLDLKHAKESRS